MCVIIVKQAGVKVPTKKFLKKAFDVNHDGCGFATSNGHYYRSTDFKEFWKEFHNVASDEQDIIIHFRWATHGSIKETNCHPFKARVRGKDVFFAHNGVLPIDSENDMTDSEIYFRQIFLPLLRNCGFSQAFEGMVSSMAGYSNRFVYLDKEGLHMYGKWEKHTGLLLSNTRFLQTSYLTWHTHRASNVHSLFDEDKYAGVGTL